MNSLNSVLLEGHLTRDPVLHETPRGTPVCSFGLAVNRYYRQEEETVQEVSFFEIEAWSKLAHYITSQFQKGVPMRVVGRLKQERWEDPDGNNRTKVKVIGEHVEPIISGRNGSSKNTSKEDQSIETVDAGSSVEEEKTSATEMENIEAGVLQEELLV